MSDNKTSQAVEESLALARTLRMELVGVTRSRYIAIAQKYQKLEAAVEFAKTRIRNINKHDGHTLKVLDEAIAFDPLKDA